MANRTRFRNSVENAVQRVLRWVTRPLPHRLQLALAGGAARLLLALLPAQRRRVEGNLRRVYPDITPGETTRLRNEMARNIGRTLIEIFHSDQFIERAHALSFEGPGLKALEDAKAFGKGAIVVSGHFGQWEAIRTILKQRGLECGAIYRAFNNEVFDGDFRPRIEAFGTPVVVKGRAGMRGMLQQISRGGIMAILLDQRTKDGVMLDFLGHPANTATTAADLALKYDVPLVPTYGIRQPDKTSVKVVFEAPIPEGTAVEMTQAVNDSLGARVRAAPEQWFWLHRRWGR